MGCVRHVLKKILAERVVMMTNEFCSTQKLTQQREFQAWKGGGMQLVSSQSYCPKRLPNVIQKVKLKASDALSRTEVWQTCQYLVLRMLRPPLVFAELY